jgi:hypothetical protein
VETGVTDAAALGTIGIGVGETAGALFRIGGAVGVGTVCMVSLSGSKVTGRTVAAGCTVGAALTVGAGLLVGTVIVPRWPNLLVWAEAKATVITHATAIPKHLIIFIKSSF